MFGVIGGLISTVVSAVTTLAPKVLGAVCGIVASKLATTLSEVGMAIVGEIMKFVGVQHGNLEEKDNIDEIGAKAELSEKKPEDFGTVKEYMAHLKTITLPSEHMDNLSDKDKFKNTIFGASIVLKDVEETTGINITPEFISAMANNKVSKETVSKIIDNFKSSDTEFDFNDYVNQDLPIKETLETESLIKDALRTTHPDLTEEQISDKITELKNTGN